MGKITLELPDDLEKRLRMRAVEIYGGRRGSLRKCIIEAIEQWLKTKSR